MNEQLTRRIFVSNRTMPVIKSWNPLMCNDACRSHGMVVVYGIDSNRTVCARGYPPAWHDTYCGSPLYYIPLLNILTLQGCEPADIYHIMDIHGGALFTVFSCQKHCWQCECLLSWPYYQNNPIKRFSSCTCLILKLFLVQRHFSKILINTLNSCQLGYKMIVIRNTKNLKTNRNFWGQNLAQLKQKLQIWYH